MGDVHFASGDNDFPHWTAKKAREGSRAKAGSTGQPHQGCLLHPPPHLFAVWHLSLKSQNSITFWEEPLQWLAGLRLLHLTEGETGVP